MELEVEAKLVAPSAAALARLPGAAESLGYHLGEPERVMVVDHYLDTEDLNLHRAGWALRLRDLGTRKLLTLKERVPPRDGIAKRREYEQEVHWDEDSGWAIPQDVLEGRLRDLLHDSSLAPLFLVRQDRTLFPLAADTGEWCEVALDRVAWEAAAGTETAFEAELELYRGDETWLRKVAEELRAELGWEPGAVSKYERGLALAGLAPSA